MQKLPKEYSASHDVLIFFTCLSRNTGLPVDDLRHPDTSLYDTFFSSLCGGCWLAFHASTGLPAGQVLKSLNPEIHQDQLPPGFSLAFT